jgi:hypothetical protein
VTRLHVTQRLLATVCIVSSPALARAQTIPAACRPVIDAGRKTITTAHHAYSTETARAEQKTRTTEGITVGDAMYVQVNGKWRRSPVTAKQLLATMDKSLATVTAYSCTRVGDEAERGTAAAVYTTHMETENIKADARVWIAKGSGLVLRTEEDHDLGGGDKRHVSTRYDYTNVQAPAGIK